MINTVACLSAVKAQYLMAGKQQMFRSFTDACQTFLRQHFFKEAPFLAIKCSLKTSVGCSHAQFQYQGVTAS